MLIDLHCHSRFTRGCDLDPRVLIRRAAALGLDGICFTETNAIDGAAELKAFGKGASVKVFVGMELTTDRGHYLCYFPDPEAVPDPVQMWGSNAERPWPVREVLERVVQLGAVVAAAHPYDRETPVAPGDFIHSLKELKAIEGYNPRRKPHVNNLAADAAETMHLPCIAGSDARGDLFELGKAATLFKRPVADERELCEALRGGEVWAVIFGGMPPGLAGSTSGGKKRPNQGAPEKKKKFRGRRRDL